MPWSRPMAASRGVEDIIRKELAVQFAEIERFGGGDGLVFYSPILRGVDNIVREALDSLDTRDPNGRLVLVLHTAGGVVEVVERIVDTIRQRYKEVVVIVPDSAMSAGTILAMAADQILMDDFGRLGPIDPQLERPDGRLVPALSYLVQLNRLIEKSANGAKLTPPELALIAKLDLAELHEFEQAKELSIELLKQWLVAYKFKDWKVTRTRQLEVTLEMKQERAEEIALTLSDNVLWHSHGRGISRESLDARVNLRIDKLEDNAELAKAVRSYHDCLIDNLARTKMMLHVQTRSF